VDELVANPERIKEIQRQCKEDRAKVGDELCMRAAAAAERRFFGDGRSRRKPVAHARRTASRFCDSFALLPRYAAAPCACGVFIVFATARTLAFGLNPAITVFDRH
jgi:hypothetical protein